ncbi:type VII toxin-antitoxin system HepT family RNase toxin [Zhongshania marina]|jgi:uncharacterized protein YutE (UPF0331/DUF86 family)|uniref:DUF86 domain-containing protein n=1 Tax=Zhongshania marina TaxID=2304603 RepID=A0ABX9W9Q3_9GAMM|nr:DUF86 domain-containing protein [Zhongshania marina]
MSPANSAYLLALSEHIGLCEHDLKTLQDILTERDLSRLEQHAAERTLQVLIESAIGLAKHWAKAELNITHSEALASFNNLADSGLIEKSDNWRRVVGLRNVLVHDYLNVDIQIVQDIIKKAYFKDILNFARQACKALEHLGSVKKS